MKGLRKGEVQEGDKGDNKIATREGGYQGKMLSQEREEGGERCNAGGPRGKGGKIHNKEGQLVEGKQKKRVIPSWGGTLREFVGGKKISLGKREVRQKKSPHWGQGDWRDWFSNLAFEKVRKKEKTPSKKSLSISEGGSLQKEQV